MEEVDEDYINNIFLKYWCEIKNEHIILIHGLIDKQEVEHRISHNEFLTINMQNLNVTCLLDAGRKK